MTATIPDIATSTESLRRKVQPSRSSWTYVVPAGRSSTGCARIGRGGPREDSRAQAEGHGVDDERVGRAGEGYQGTGERRTRKAGRALDRRGQAGDALERHVGAAGERRHERVLGAVAGSSQPAGDGDEGEQHREGQGTGEVEQRDHPDHHHAQQVAGDRDPARPQTVDQRSGECLDDDQRQQLGEGDQAGLGRRPGGGEHQPRDRDHRDAGAAQGDRVGDQEPDERGTASGGGPHASSPPR